MLAVVLVIAPSALFVDPHSSSKPQIVIVGKFFVLLAVFSSICGSVLAQLLPGAETTDAESRTNKDDPQGAKFAASMIAFSILLLLAGTILLISGA